MNEINFEIKDIEKINLSMDVGVKEIFPPIENLEVTPTKEQQMFNHENSYGYDEVKVNPIPDEYIIPDGTLPITENTIYDVRRYARVNASVHPTPNLQDKSITIIENGTQSITFDKGYDGLNSVEVTTNIESGGGSGVQQPYITQRNINAPSTTFTGLTETIYKSYGNNATNMAIIFGFVRSDYSLFVNDNQEDIVPIIAEKEFKAGDGTKQKLLVGYYLYDGLSDLKLTLNQLSSGRIALGYFVVSNCGVPVFIDDTSGLSTSSLGIKNIDISPDEYLNVYFYSDVYTPTVTSENFSLNKFSTRIGYFVSNEASEKKIIVNSTGGTYSEIIHIRLPFKKK